MEITILTPDERILSLNVNHSITVEDLKSLIEDETRMPPQLQRLLFDGTEMRNSKRLTKYGVRDGELLVMTTMDDSSVPPSDVLSAAFDNIGAMKTLGCVGSSIWFNPDGSAKEPSALKRHILNDADMMERISLYDPELAGVLRENGTTDEWLQLLLRIRHCQRAELPRRKQDAELVFLRAADESDSEVRRKMKAAYPQNGCIIDEWNPNLEHITSYIPKQKHLRVDVMINGIPVKAVIDTASSISMMSEYCAEMCGLMRLKTNDGEKKILHDASDNVMETLGQINIVPIKMGDMFFLGSFTVNAHDAFRCLFGRDMLFKNECIIDMKKKVLINRGGVVVPLVSLGNKNSPDSDSDSEVSSSLYSTGSSLTHEFTVKVCKLVELGFAKEAAIKALKVVGGDEELAAEFLFGH